MRLTIVLLACLLAVACSKQPQPGPALITPATAGQSGGQVSVLTAGAEPRHSLRYQLSKGSQGETAIEYTSGIATLINPKNPKSKQIKIVPPKVRLIAGMMIGDVAGDGSARVSVTLKSAELVKETITNPAQARQLEEQLRALVGLTTTMTLSTQGAVRDLKIDAPPDAPPAILAVLETMRSAVGQLTLPFPGEPVGPGARWQTRQQVETRGMEIEQTSLFTLVRWEPERAYITMVTSVKAPPQRLFPTGLPPGSIVQLNRHEGMGQSKLIVSMRSPMPRSQMSLQSETWTTTVARGRKLTIGVATDLQMSIAPIDTPGAAAAPPPGGSPDAGADPQ
jgi:CheY-specific phosphatase CheX